MWYVFGFQEADVEMKELQKEIKESTISSGRQKDYFPLVGIIEWTCI